jgi:zinc protease
MPSVRTGVLASGFRYYILANAKPENRAYLTLAVDAGSVLEEDDERGLAHFVEHMAFNGTKRFPEADLINYLRSLGMRFGPEVNAYTNYDETVYGIEVPVEQNSAGVKGIPPEALAILDDWTQAITFDPQDVDDERLVILEEYRSRLGPMDRIWQKLLPILFQGSPYADRRPIGLPEIIETAPPERLAAFYRRWYRPDTMALIFVGDFDPEALEASLPEHFTMPKAETPLDKPVYDLPGIQKGFRPEIFTDPELPFTYLDLYYKLPPKARTGDLAEYRAGLMDALIELILAQRFSEGSANPASPYIEAESEMVRYGATARFFTLSAQAKAGETEGAIRELFRAKEAIVRYGFTQAELDRAKRTLKASVARLYGEKDKIESSRYLQDLTRHFLDGTPAPGIDWEFEAVQALLPGITVKEIGTWGKRYFSSEDTRLFVYTPEAEADSTPSKERMVLLEKESRKAPMDPPKEEALSEELLPEPPEPGVITAQGEDPETGAVLWDLGNGGKVIIRETANKNDEIIFYALARGGTEGVSPEAFPSVRLAGEMWGLSGVGEYSLQDLQKKLAGRQVSLSFWSSLFLRGLQGSSTVGDLKPFFELLYLYFTQPRLDSSAAEALVDQYRTLVSQRKEHPDVFFRQEIQRIFYASDFRFAPLEIEDLERVNPDEALDFIRRGLNPGDFTFVFVGNGKPEVLQEYVETYLASIPSGEAWNTWKDPGISRPGKTDRAFFKGKENKSSVFIGRNIGAEYSEEDAAAGEVLEEYLDIRLIEEIRERLGGVYGISSSVSLSPLPAGGLSLQVFFGCDPKRAEELYLAVEQELQKILTDPVNSDTFAKAVAALQKGWEIAQESNFTLAQSYTNSAVIYGLPLSRLDKRLGLYGQVTPAGMQAVLRRLLAQDPIRLILYPEGWTP